MRENPDEYADSEVDQKGETVEKPENSDDDDNIEREQKVSSPLDDAVADNADGENKDDEVVEPLMAAFYAKLK